MSDLSPDARRLLDSARAHDRLDRADRRRLRANIAAQIAVATGTAAGVGVGAAKASEAATTTLTVVKAETATKLSWSLASLATSKGIAVCAAVAALSTSAAITARYHREASPRHATTPRRHDVAPAQHVTVSQPTRAVTVIAPAAPRDPASLAAAGAIEARRALPIARPALARRVDTASPVAPVASVTRDAPVAPSREAEPTPVTAEPVLDAPRAAEPVAAPVVAAGPDAIECLREADRALLQSEPVLALGWIERCRAHTSGPLGPQLITRGIAALCMEGRDDDARAIARNLLSRDGSESTAARVSRTCARDVIGARR
ncbi:MAG: hypothetical protein U0326_43990 [Polyangiales bacterium]